MIIAERWRDGENFVCFPGGRYLPWEGKGRLVTKGNVVSEAPFLCQDLCDSWVLRSTQPPAGHASGCPGLRIPSHTSCLVCLSPNVVPLTCPGAYKSLSEDPRTHSPRYQGSGAASLQTQATEEQYGQEPRELGLFSLKKTSWGAG